jgi:hypothetical protein
MNQSNQTRSLPQNVQAQPYQGGPAAHPQLNGLQAAPIPRTQTFFIDYRSTMDGSQFQGQFTTKKLTVRDVSSIGVRKVQLNGGYYYDENRPGLGIDPQTDFLNSMIAHLEIALIQSPLNFKVDEIIDTGLLAAIYTKVMEFENSFFRSSGEQNGNLGSSQNAGVPEGKESGIAGHATPVVGGQVQASLDP